MTAEQAQLEKIAAALGTTSKALEAELLAARVQAEARGVVNPVVRLAPQCFSPTLPPRRFSLPI